MTRREVSTEMRRLRTTDPLTPDDVAFRLDKALDRVMRIMWDAQQLGIMDEVKGSRYLGPAIGHVAYELQMWNVHPHKVKGDDRYAKLPEVEH